MSNETMGSNARILVIDDNPQIHSDFNKILGDDAGGSAADNASLDALEAMMLGAPAPTAAPASAHGDVVFDLTHAHQGEEGYDAVVRAIAEGKPYCTIFIDMRMPPGWDGLRTLMAIREVDSDATIVICTAYSDHSWDEIAAKVAHLDKLLILKKPFDPVELIALTRALRERWRLLQQTRARAEELEQLVRVRTAELESERAKDKFRLGELEEIVEARTAELRKTALHDKLTGLPNRAMFYDRLLGALGRSRRDAKYQFAVLFLDFDRFKVINDSLGHEYGDRLLVAISERLAAVLSAARDKLPPEVPPPMAARLGGDEFCVLVEGYKDDAVVLDIAQLVLATLASAYNLNGREVNSTASIGVTFSRFGYRSAEEVLRDADIAMYQAKAAGRGRCVAFDPRMHEQVMRRLVIENDLRYAVERNEFKVLFQPIVSITNGEMVGAEALLRWKHGERGFVSPVDFIPIAEETGDIIPIGAWVFEQVCRQLCQLDATLAGNIETGIIQGEAPPRPYVSVNVSRKQLVEPSFILPFIESLRRTRVDPTRFVIEVTESTLIDEPRAAAQAINAIRELGMRVFLDDFGTGQSSLGSMRRFTLDGLKLDKSFLDIGVASRRTAAVIHSAITLARDLDMAVIAEGVESLEQLALLQTLGCELAQGFLFARPSTQEQIEAMLRSQRWLPTEGLVTGRLSPVQLTPAVVAA